MTHYHTFLGIDIGKFSFVVNVFGQKTVTEYATTPEGFIAFFDEHKELLPNALCVLETTGGYETELLYALCSQGFSVHRADTCKVKNFIRSWGTSAKTDALDAKALARYGQERHATLEPFKPQNDQSILLFQLVQRRNDLKRMLVAEKNRVQAPGSSRVRSSCEAVIEALTKALKEVTETIQETLKLDPDLFKKYNVLRTIKGVGEIVAMELLVLLPELGTLNRKQIAALAGVAPRANDSGRYSGYRSVGRGRQGVKPVLFMAAMSAGYSKSPLGEFYKRLLENGKKKKVALVALMRKIIVMANAKLRDLAREELAAAAGAAKG